MFKITSKITLIASLGLSLGAQAVEVGQTIITFAVTRDGTKTYESVVRPALTAEESAKLRKANESLEKALEQSKKIDPAFIKSFSDSRDEMLKDPNADRINGQIRRQLQQIDMTEVKAAIANVETLQKETVFESRPDLESADVEVSDFVISTLRSVEGPRIEVIPVSGTVRLLSSFMDTFVPVMGTMFDRLVPTSAITKGLEKFMADLQTFKATYENDNAQARAAWKKLLGQQ